MDIEPKEAYAELATEDDHGFASEHQAGLGHRSDCTDCMSSIPVHEELDHSSTAAVRPQGEGHWACLLGTVERGHSAGPELANELATCVPVWVSCKDSCSLLVYTKFIQ